MGTSNCTQLVTSDREKWDKVFGGLVKLLKSQQEQLETLLKERHFLEDRIKTQHERWVSDIRLYEDHISQASLLSCQKVWFFLDFKIRVLKTWVFCDFLCRLMGIWWRKI